MPLSPHRRIKAAHSQPSSGRAKASVIMAEALMAWSVPRFSTVTKFYGRLSHGCGIAGERIYAVDREWLLGPQMSS